jgi:L-ascorbate oxidase
VLLSVDPGKVFPYEYNIPSTHPAGTFWYHSHRHGSTALSVSSGMEGVLIIKGDRQYQDRIRNGGVADIDSVLHNQAGQDFKDRVLLFQQIAYGCFSDAAYQQLETDPVSKKWVCKTGETGVVENYQLQFGPSSWVASGRYTGILEMQPVLEMRAGEIERWRLVHGGVRDTVNLQIVRSTQIPVASGAPGAPSVALRSLTDFSPAELAAPQQLIAGAEALKGDALRSFVDQCSADAPERRTEIAKMD